MIINHVVRKGKYAVMPFRDKRVPKAADFQSSLSRQTLAGDAYCKASAFSHNILFQILLIA